MTIRLDTLRSAATVLFRVALMLAIFLPCAFAATDAPSTFTLESARAGLALASGTVEGYVELSEMLRAFGDEEMAGRFAQFARAKAAEEDGGVAGTAGAASEATGAVAGEADEGGGVAGAVDTAGDAYTAGEVAGSSLAAVDARLTASGNRPDFQALVERRRARGKSVPEPENGKRLVAPEAWIGAILDDMQDAGLENEAIRFALRIQPLAPSSVGPRLKTLRAAWTQRLTAYAANGATVSGTATNAASADVANASVASASAISANVVVAPGAPVDPPPQLFGEPLTPPYASFATGERTP